MKAIIIAGGESKRLRPATVNIPKTLLKVDEKIILEHILDAVRENGIRDVVILTGHGHDYVNGFAQLHNEHYPDTKLNIQYIENYADYGNIIALRAAKDLFETDSVIINSDTIFHPDILKKLLASDEKFAMAIDDHKTLGEEEMKVLVDEDMHITRVHKSLDPAGAHGEYVGVLKFEQGLHSPIARSTEAMISEDPSVYYEDAIQHMIDNHDVKIKSISTDGLPVIEIDTHEELELARDVIKKIQQ